jgi:mRNA-degrading endonuclease YafQ of YafQ-DinJ toxin-antitoxin module
MELFIDDPFNPKLRTHKLSGKLSGQWAASIDDEYRIVFEFLTKNSVLLIDFGTSILMLDIANWWKISTSSIS